MVRLNKRGILSNSKPCLHCLVHMKKYYEHNIRHIYFSSDTGEIYKKTLDQLLNDKIHISRGNRSKNCKVNKLKN